MPYLWPKRLKNHTLWGSIYLLYSPARENLFSYPADAGCNWKCSARDMFQWVPAHLRWIADVLKSAKCKSNGGNFNHSTCKYGSNGLTGVRCVRILRPASGGHCLAQIMIRRYMFTYAATVSQTAPAALSQVGLRENPSPGIFWSSFIHAFTDWYFSWSLSWPVRTSLFVSSGRKFIGS